MPWSGAMLEASCGEFFAREILPALPAFDALAGRAGLVVGLGCGNGWYLRHLLGRYPGLHGLGLDGFEQNVVQAQARARAHAAGLEHRLRFEVHDVHHAAFGELARLIALNRALHHV